MGTLTEAFRFDVVAGADLSVMPKMISRAPNRVFRPVELRIEAIGGFVQIGASGSDVPGGIVPVAVQLDFVDPSKHCVATSGVKVSGAVPRTVRTAYPASGDRFEPTYAADGIIAVISGVCLGAVNGSASQAARIHGVVYFSIRYGPEAIPSSCPAPILYTALAPSACDDDLSRCFDRHQVSSGALPCARQLEAVESHPPHVNRGVSFAQDWSSVIFRGSDPAVPCSRMGTSPPSRVRYSRFQHTGATGTLAPHRSFSVGDLTSLRSSFESLSLERDNCHAWVIGDRP